MKITVKRIPNYRSRSDVLMHAGKKGMKWGYSDGAKNGNRTAQDEEELAGAKLAKARVYYTQCEQDLISAQKSGNKKAIHEAEVALDSAAREVKALKAVYERKKKENTVAGKIKKLFS